MSRKFPRGFAHDAPLIANGYAAVPPNPCHPTFNTLYGSVKVYRHSASNDLVVIKSCHLPSMDRVRRGVDRRSMDDPIGEVATLEHLRPHPHPSLAKYVESFLTATHLYIVTRLVEGYDLQTLVQKNVPLSRLDVRTIVLQITQGLEHMHRHSVAMRDVSLENVVVSRLRDGTMRAVLIDMGASIIVGDPRNDDHLQKGRLGRRQFSKKGLASPEVYCTRNVSPMDWYKGDMFALGVVVWQILFRGYMFDNGYEPLKDNHSWRVRTTRGVKALMQMRRIVVTTDMDDVIDFLTGLTHEAPRARWNAMMALKSRWLTTKSVH